MAGTATSARGAVRRLVARLPAGLRARALARLGPRAARRLGIAGGEIGLVSLVVVCEAGDEPRLDDCLRSLRAQWHGLLEVIVCPVGEARAGLAAVGEDPRFRVLTSHPPATAWPEAANAGAATAQGRFLGFVRACDTLLPHAVTDLASSLAGSGSDLATGRLVQQGQPDTWIERAQRDSHTRPGRRLPPGSRPELAGDLTIGNHLVRTRAWRRTRLAFEVGDDWLLSPTMAQALKDAGAVDVLDVPTYRHAHEHGRRAYGAMPSPLPELGDWEQRVGRVGRRFGQGELADGWGRHVLDAGLPRFLVDAERATEEQWQALVALAQAEQLKRLAPRADTRTLLWLTAQDRREAVEAWAAEAFELGDDLRTTRVGDRVVATWSAANDVPVDVRTLTAAETPLVATVHRVRRSQGVAEIFARVEHLDLADEDPQLSVTTSAGERLDTVAAPDPAADRWARRRFQSVARGAFRVSLPTPAPDGLELRLRLRVGDLERETTLPLPSTPATPPSPAARVDDVWLDGSDLVLTGAGDLVGLTLGDDLRARRSGPDEVRLALRPVSFGREVEPAPGPYPLTHPGGAAATAHLVERSPVDLVSDRLRLRMRVERDGSLTGHVGPPLGDDEAGPYAQERLRADYAARSAPTDPDVFYFESYAGRSATDSPRAMLAELRRRRPGLTAYWGVLDHSHTVPEGAVPVVLRSRAWYDVLARARCLVVNTDLDEWYLRRPDQLVVQTFHGYPSKAMGAQQWRARQFPPSRVAAIRRRTVETWGLILTPTPEMTRHYREQYSYDGPVHEHGYPRDDDLTAPDRDRRRARVRALLGIAEHQVAVLYAPTWRDHLATRPRAAAMADYLDVRQAAAGLGAGHVLLLRGHRFHDPARADTGAGDAAVVDVTDHPEINDLILASDVAVLDYSSLRFDYALTGRPMIFLVPDLEQYDGGSRGFLFPFAGSAPGPLVRETREVVGLVHDLPGLRARWSAEVAAFDTAYNPWQDGRATARSVDALEALLPGTSP